MVDNPPSMPLILLKIPVNLNMQPTPIMSDNACPFNTYVGLDRGLFLTRKLDYPFIRVHSAQWAVNGPIASPGILRFTLMGYATLPVTPEDYTNGTLITTAAGDISFDCFARGGVYEPIMAEYFINNIYFNHYLNGGIKLEAYEITQVQTAAQKIVDAGVGDSGITTVQLTVDFPVQPNGLPIARGNIVLNYTGIKDGNAVSRTITLPDGVYDPLQFAMDHIKTV